MKKLTASIFLLLPLVIHAQFTFIPVDTIPVTENSGQLENPWAGGINYAQVSRIDLDQDGQQDLFIFDRTGDKTLTFLNTSTTAGQLAFEHTNEYDLDFPDLRYWAVLRDYDGDGKKDIFTSTNGSIAIYKNTSTTSSGLNFQHITDQVLTDNYPDDTTNNLVNIYVSQADIPAINDIDGDGDLDILTFGLLNNTLVEYHKNMSMENHGHRDSVNYQLANRCWGYFSEGISDNTVNLDDTCSFNVPNPEGNRHAGSTLLAFDEDGDGIKDLLLGDLSFSNMVLVGNGGSTTSSHMTRQDTLFPVYDTPVNLDIFPAAFYEDINNDGARDLVVSPNKKNISENQSSVYYYKNDGTDQAPDFTFVQEDLLQEEMIDVGEGAMPVLFDHDQDGLKDLLIGNYNIYQPNGNSFSQIAYYRNNGTATQPEFELVEEDYEQLSTLGLGLGLHPTFGDLDNDGDKDMIVGTGNGYLHFFRNSAGAGNPSSFSLAQPQFEDASGNPIDIGDNSTPQLFDLNQDGKLDLLIGEKGGNINYYRNSGTIASPSFELVNDTVGDVLVSSNYSGYSVPYFFDDNGTTRLFSGSVTGFILSYDSINNNLHGTWNLVDNNITNLSEGTRTAPVLGDLDNDGYPDLISGNYSGGLRFYFGGSPTSMKANTPSDFKVWTYPSPATTNLNVELKSSPQQTTHLFLYNSVGELLSSQEISSRRTRIQVRNLPGGLYFGKIVQGNAQSTFRFMVAQ